MAEVTTNIIASLANSIRFAIMDDLAPSFDNTLTDYEDFLYCTKHSYSQTYFKNDQVPVQFKGGTTAICTIKIYNCETGANVEITAPAITVYDNFQIFDFLVDFSDTGHYYIVATSQTSTLVSELIEIIEEDEDTAKEYYTIEWFNKDPTSYINNYEFDYTTDQALANVNFIRIRGVFKDYDPSINKTVFDNQSKKTKLSEDLYRKLRFISEGVPRWLSEKLTIASGHDKFIVNDVEYVRDDDPEVGNLEFSNTSEWSAWLTQVSILGFNTHDKGFTQTTCNMEMDIKDHPDATGQGSDVVLAGFSITQIVASKVSGNPVLKIGYTPGGSEIFRDEVINYTDPPMFDNQRFSPVISGQWTIYWEVSGGVIDLFIQTIKFRSS